MNDTPTSKYWRERAEEAQTKAENMVSENGKRWMLEIARLYGKLAAETAKREAKKGEKNSN